MIRWLLVASAILAWLFAGMLLFASARFEAPIGIEMNDKIATIAQAQGAILAGLGVIDFLCSRVSDRQALRAVVLGNLVVQILSLGVAGRALVLGIFPASAAPSVVIHVVLGALFAVAMVKLRAPRASLASD